MSITTQRRASGRIARARGTPSEIESRDLPPVVWWGLAGFLMFALMAYVGIRWVTGPNFKSVPYGPNTPPEWMRIVLTTITVTGFPAAAAMIWWFLIRPWRRERRITSDGLLVIAYATLFFQDPLSNIHGWWFTYNSWLTNKGSWVADVPGWQSYAKPGRTLAEPFLAMGPGYIYFWVILVACGTVGFRGIQRRWPRLGTAGGLLGCLGAIMVFDFVLEALLWMKTGFYSYNGGIGPKIFSGHSAYPVLQAVMIAFTITPYVLLQLYRNDRGETFVERGVDTLRVGARAKVLLRFLALVAICQLFYFVGYTAPASEIGASAHAWPTDVQRTSYFLDRLCGQLTDRACPGPAIPNSHGNSAYVGRHGQLILPNRTTIPPATPLAPPADPTQPR